MENNPTADEVTPAPGDEPPGHFASQPEESTSEPPTDTPGATTGGDALAELARRAITSRLPAADEERATILLKEALLDGKAAIAKAVEALPKLPWIVGVRAVEAAWPEMKATARTQLFKGLSEDESDGARRVRLSLARALFKQDIPLALKIAVGVAKDLRENETRMVSQKNAQIFAAVFIGKAKPWLTQLPLSELKTADADALVHCAVFSAFSLAHPPATQLAVLKWAAEAGQATRLDESAVATVVRSVSRWSAKWQAALLAEVPDLPEPITLALRAATTESGEPRGPANRMSANVPAEFAPGEEDEREPGGLPQKKERPVYEPRPQKSATAPEERKERPVYQPRRAAGGPVQELNLAEMLRQIDAHVHWLRNELNSAQSKLRQRDNEGRRSKSVTERSATVVGGDPTVEELVRTTLQLENRIAELQQRISDLTADAEDRAATISAHAGDEAADSGSRLRALLALKLQDGFDDFVALENESPSVVVQQHYRSLLGEVFEVLRHEGIPLKKEVSSEQ